MRHEMAAKIIAETGKTKKYMRTRIVSLGDGDYGVFLDGEVIREWGEWLIASAEPRKEVSLRMPRALWAKVRDRVEETGNSVNDQIVDAVRSVV